MLITAEKEENEENEEKEENEENEKEDIKNENKEKEEKKEIVESEEEKEKRKLKLEYNKLKHYMNSSGLSLAFNIIFAELITKQIEPEKFFDYTSLRLKQIGKKLETIPDNKEIQEEKKTDDEVFMTNADNQNI